MNAILLRRREKFKFRILPINNPPEWNVKKYIEFLSHSSESIINAHAIPTHKHGRIDEGFGWTTYDIKMFQMAFGLMADGEFGRHTKTMYRHVRKTHQLKTHRDVMFLVKERLSVRDCPNVKQPNTI